MKILDGLTIVEEGTNNFTLVNKTDNGDFQIKFIQDKGSKDVNVEITATDHLKVDFFMDRIDNDVIKTTDSTMPGLKDVDGTIILEIDYKPENSDKEVMTDFLKKITKSFIFAIKENTTFHNLYFKETNSDISIANKEDEYFVKINANSDIIEAFSKNEELFDKMTVNAHGDLEISIKFDNENFESIRSIISYLEDDAFLNGKLSSKKIEHNVGVNDEEVYQEHNWEASKKERICKFVDNIKTEISIVKDEDSSFVIINAQNSNNKKIIQALNNTEVFESELKVNAYGSIEGKISLKEDITIENMFEIIENSISDVIKKKAIKQSSSINNNMKPDG